MSSPKYLASVDNSTVYQPPSDERLVRLCHEVVRTFARGAGGEVMPRWGSLDEKTKGRIETVVETARINWRIIDNHRTKAEQFAEYEIVEAVIRAVDILSRGDC